MEHEKLLFLIQEISQILQDITSLFERMEKSIEIVNEMKSNITKWTTIFNQTNMMMMNYIISLKERTENVQKQLTNKHKQACKRMMSSKNTQMLIKNHIFYLTSDVSFCIVFDTFKCLFS